MRIRRMVGGATTIAALTGATLGIAGPAAAQSTAFPTLQTLGSICWGGVNAFAGPAFDRSGIISGQVTFDSWTPTFGQPCAVGVTVGWRNLDTGATGAFSDLLIGNNSFEVHSKQFELPSGPGRVALTLTSDRLSLPVPSTEITVP